MGKKLATTTTVTDQAGQGHTFEAGTEPPEWAEKLINNPRAWGEEPDQQADTRDYEDMKVEDLKELARDRGIDLGSNKKADIIEELKAWDADNR
jgi:hypothetical protein